MRARSYRDADANAESHAPAVMTRDEVDRAIAGLTAVRARAAAALLAIDDHPGHQYLREHTLTGQTREVWRDLEPRIQQAWAQYTVLNATLEEVSRLRDRRERPGQQRFAELSRLLGEHVVELGPTGMPVEGAADQPAERLSLAELGERMDQTCDSALAVFLSVEAANGAVTARLSNLAGTLSQIRAQAATLGLRHDLELEPLVETFGRLGQHAVDDPLGSVLRAGAVDVGLCRLEGDVAAISQQLADVAAARQEFPERLAALQALAGRVEAAEGAAQHARALATVKIARSGLPECAERLPEVQARVAAIEQHGRAHRWPLVASQLPAAEALARQALAAAEEHADGAYALLARRDELRGRLDSYRVKAGRLGFGEHAGLTTAYRRAWDLLWTAPCDLQAATLAVCRYQEMVAAPPFTEGAPAS